MRKFPTKRIILDVNPDFHAMVKEEARKLNITMRTLVLRYFLIEFKKRKELEGK